MQKSEISVKYRNVEGMHVFTSPDVKGFYVASMDAREAFEEVSAGLQILLRLNERIDAKVAPTMSVDDFLSLVGAGGSAPPHPTAVDSARFKFSSQQAA